MLDRLMRRVEEMIDEGETSAEDSTDRTEEMFAFKPFGQCLLDESLARVDSVDSGVIEGGEESRDSSRDRLSRERETVVHWISLDLCLVRSVSRDSCWPDGPGEYLPRSIDGFRRCWPRLYRGTRWAQSLWGCAPVFAKAWPQFSKN